MYRLSDKERQKLASMIFTRLVKKFGWVDHDDLMSYAHFGLLLAQREFDPDRDDNFDKFVNIKGFFLAIDEMRAAKLVYRKTSQKKPTIGYPIDSDGVSVQFSEANTGSIDECRMFKEDKFSTVEDKDEIDFLLSKIPIRERKAINLVFFEELSQKEAAKVMGISPNLMSLVYNKALKTMRKIHKEHLLPLK